MALYFYQNLFGGRRRIFFGEVCHRDRGIADCEAGAYAAKALDNTAEKNIIMGRQMNERL